LSFRLDIPRLTDVFHGHAARSYGNRSARLGAAHQVGALLIWLRAAHLVRCWPGAAHVSRGTSGQVVALHGQFLDRKTTAKITGLTVTATTWVSFQEVDVTVNVPATATTGNKKIILYDPYSSSYGYYGRGSCSTCLSVN